MFLNVVRFCAVVVLFLEATTGCAMARPEGISRLGFSIQVGAFAEVKNAERLTTKLQEKGIEAFYFRKENNVYAVRFGDFRSRQEAKTNARKLVGEGLITSYFIAPPQSADLPKPKRSESRPAPAIPARTTAAVPPKTTATRTGNMGAIAARTAERFVGIPYRWGGENVVDGMDCSGFVRAVYNLCGVNIPRTSGEQFRVGEPVAKEDLRDGDLVFFGASAESINHVGIYVGDGRFVHAPRRGDDIKTSSLSDAYFDKKFIGGKRYL